MRYDFDVLPVIPEEKRAEFTSRGIHDPRLDETVALFRDWRTAGALRGADPVVRELFHQAGFSLGVSRSEVPDGRFRRDEAAAREQVIARLNGLILTRQALLRAAEWNGFSLEDFIAAVEAARPAAARDRSLVLTWPSWACGGQARLAVQGH